MNYKEKAQQNENKSFYTSGMKHNKNNICWYGNGKM